MSSKKEISGEPMLFFFFGFLSLLAGFASFFDKYPIGLSWVLFLFGASLIALGVLLVRDELKEIALSESKEVSKK